MPTELCSQKLASLLSREAHERIVLPCLYGIGPFTFAGFRVPKSTACADILPIDLLYFYETKARGKRKVPAFPDGFTLLSVDGVLWECRVVNFSKIKEVADYCVGVEFRVNCTPIEKKVFET